MPDVHGAETRETDQELGKEAILGMTRRYRERDRSVSFENTDVEPSVTGAKGRATGN